MSNFLAYRNAFNLAITAVIGTAGVRAYPFSTANVFLALLETRTPALCAALGYLYTTLWFSTPLLVLSLVTSLATIAAFRSDRAIRFEPLPSYSKPETRGDLLLVLSEQHRAQEPGRSEHPTWLTIPRRGLHTGMMILGAVGTGKTSACMYPYVDQLLAWRAGTESEKVGGLEVKGDSAPRSATSFADMDERPITSKSASTRSTATTRCTTSSNPTPSPIQLRRS